MPTSSADLELGTWSAPSPQLLNQTSLKRLFIPSKVDNNRHIDVEAYKQNLRASGSKELVSAWLDGDWSVTLGAFFDCWDSKRHVVRPFEVPAEWMRFRSMDWGSASPFSVGWWAVVQDDFETDGRVLPRGCLVRYREWYGMKPGQPNVGVKINADVIGLSIAAREKDEKISYGVLDPSAMETAFDEAWITLKTNGSANIRPNELARRICHLAMEGGA